MRRPAFRRSPGARATAWLLRHGPLLTLTVVAFLVRLHHNRRVHPPEAYLFSDMLGYVERANALVTEPWTRRPDLTLFPYGTHVLLAGVKAVFGLRNDLAAATAYAAFGALGVGLSYAIALRLTRRRALAFVVGLSLVFYYPWVALGSYFLSEPPYLVCVSLVVLLSLRLADRGRRGDAWMLGLALGVGAAVRPQLLVAAGLLGVHWLLRPRAWKRRRGTLLRVALPLAAVLAFSAARVRWHHGAVLALVSTNGPLNRAFGRCHPLGIASRAPEGTGIFGPPPFGMLRAYGDRHPDTWFQLRPAMGDLLRVHGTMWDAEPLDALARACIAKTGWLKQAYYGLTHVVLLWDYNVIWPDQADVRFQRRMTAWCVWHLRLLVAPLAAAMLLAFRRRRARHALLALQLWGLVLVAVLYFGDTRFRAPYDGLILILVFDLSRQAASSLGRRAGLLRLRLGT